MCRGRLECYGRTNMQRTTRIHFGFVADIMAVILVVLDDDDDDDDDGD